MKQSQLTLVVSLLSQGLEVMPTVLSKRKKVIICGSEIQSHIIFLVYAYSYMDTLLEYTKATPSWSLRR